MKRNALKALRNDALVVCVHGIGGQKPGWSEESRRILDVPSNRWLEFTCAETLNSSPVNWVLRWAVRGLITLKCPLLLPALNHLNLGEYINDVIAYFASPGLRRQISKDLITQVGMALQDPSRYLPPGIPVVLIGHSLGSIIVQQLTRAPWRPETPPHHVYLGTPFSLPGVARFFKVPVFHTALVFKNQLDPVTGASWYSTESYFDSCEVVTDFTGHRLETYALAMWYECLGKAAHHE
jgi:hypothetical protein